MIFLVLCFNALLCAAQRRTLDFFLQQARQNSPTLREYQNQVSSLRLDSQLLRATLGPQVNGISSDNYAPVFGAWGYDEAITNAGQLSGLLQVRRNFLSASNRAAQYRTIALQRRALLDTISLSQRDLVRTITGQYITAYSDVLSLEFNRDVYDLMAREEAALKKLTEASVYKQTDYLNFYVTMQQQELTYMQAQLQYNADYLTLNYLAGLVDTTIEKIAPPSLSDSLLNTNFYQSVFYRRFVTDSARLVNEKELIDYQYKPKIGYYADAGYNSSLQTKPYKNFGFSAGVSLTIPIYNGHQKELRLAQVNIRERTRQYKRDFYLNQYRVQRQQFLQQIRSIDLLLNKINKQIEYAHTLIVANGRLLQTGDITIKDYVLAISNYLNAQNLLTQNKVSRLRILGQMAYWNENP